MHGPKAKTPVKVRGIGLQRIASVYVGEVVASIQGGITAGHTSAFDLQGPEEMSLDNSVHLLNGGSNTSLVRGGPTLTDLQPIAPEGLRRLRIRRNFRFDAVHPIIGRIY